MPDRKSTKKWYYLYDQNVKKDREKASQKKIPRWNSYPSQSKDESGDPFENQFTKPNPQQNSFNDVNNYLAKPGEYYGYYVPGNDNNNNNDYMESTYNHNPYLPGYIPQQQQQYEKPEEIKRTIIPTEALYNVHEEHISNEEKLKDLTRFYKETGTVDGYDPSRSRDALKTPFSAMTAQEANTHKFNEHRRRIIERKDGLTPLSFKSSTPKTRSGYPTVDATTLEILFKNIYHLHELSKLLRNRYSYKYKGESVYILDTYYDETPAKMKKEEEKKEKDDSTLAWLAKSAFTMVKDTTVSVLKSIFVAPKENVINPTIFFSSVTDDLVEVSNILEETLAFTTELTGKMSNFSIIGNSFFEPLDVVPRLLDDITEKSNKRFINWKQFQWVEFHDMIYNALDHVKKSIRLYYEVSKGFSSLRNVGDSGFGAKCAEENVMYGCDGDKGEPMIFTAKGVQSALYVNGINLPIGKFSKTFRRTLEFYMPLIYNGSSCKIRDLHTLKGYQDASYCMLLRAYDNLLVGYSVDAALHVKEGEMGYETIRQLTELSIYDHMKDWYENHNEFFMAFKKIYSSNGKSDGFKTILLKYSKDIDINVVFLIHMTLLLHNMIYKSHHDGSYIQDLVTSQGLE